jgi:Lrp/AsnC family transcriptional regulator for asnA, asnC and gidA
VTESAIRKRIKKLQRKGIIRRFTIDINPKRMGLEIDAFIGIDTTPESYLKVIKTISEIENIISVYSTSGDHMILAECWLKDSEALSEFIKKLEEIPGVTRTCPAIITEKVK